MKFSEQFARSSKNKEQVLVARYLGLIGEFGASAGKGSAVPANGIEERAFKQ